jgi:hypothetical protein
VSLSQSGETVTVSKYWDVYYLLTTLATVEEVLLQKVDDREEGCLMLSNLSSTMRKGSSPQQAALAVTWPVEHLTAALASCEAERTNATRRPENAISNRIQRQGTRRIGQNR